MALHQCNCAGFRIEMPATCMLYHINYAIANKIIANLFYLCRQHVVPTLFSSLLYMIFEQFVSNEHI